MTKTRNLQIITAVILAAMFSSLAMAELRLTKLFSDNMILQRDMQAPVWGWAEPGEKVVVQFSGQEKSAVAGGDGKWMVRLDPLPASCTPEILTIIGKTDRKEYKNVVVGEVWLCSGQSNMASGFKYLGLLDEIKDVDYPMIRMSGFPNEVNPIPTELIFPHYEWSVCNTQNLQIYPCVPYYFALNLWKELQIPIGVIHAGIGSSSIEAWMPPESFIGNEKFEGAVEKMEKVQKDYRLYSTYSLEEKRRIAKEISEDKYGCILKGRLNDNMTDKEAEYFFRFSLILRPACLFNYEIRAVIPFAIKGAIWYQGETDCWRKENIAGYAERQKSMVENWRKLWGQGNFPFYFAQIAPYKDYYGLTDFWLEQYKAAEEVENSAMISTVDISDVNDVHPKNKRDVGKRLALLALKNDYARKDVVASGPVYKSMKIVDGKIIVAFDCLGSGLSTKDGKEPDSFEVAADDGVFYPAKAVITADTVEVSSPDVQKPVNVRFAWNNLANPNFRNKEGLPVFPFNTAEPYFNQRPIEKVQGITK